VAVVVVVVVVVVLVLQVWLVAAARVWVEGGQQT